VWKELLLKLVILCQYNSQIHRVPAGRIVTNKKTKIFFLKFWTVVLLQKADSENWIETFFL
jgi:hypothetical protein